MTENPKITGRDWLNYLATDQTAVISLVKSINKLEQRKRRAMEQFCSEIA